MRIWVALVWLGLNVVSMVPIHEALHCAGVEGSCVVTFEDLNPFGGDAHASGVGLLSHGVVDPLTGLWVGLPLFNLVGVVSRRVAHA